MPTRILTALSLAAFSVLAIAQPTVDDNVISWPDDGWYQVQSSDGATTYCNGGTSCEVEPGIYLVINHSTDVRYRGIVVLGSALTPETITVEGNIISWPDDGWHQVQSADGSINYCNGGTSCEVDPGFYLVINHSTGTRYENVAVATTEEERSPVTVLGNVISWPDDGWYQVQSTDGSVTFCNGGQSCEVIPGYYLVINHSTGERYRNVVVPGGSIPFPLEPAPQPITADLPAPSIPLLPDPDAPPLPSPDPDDPFGFGLEFNGETPVAGGPPTQPKNLRLELVSNDWAEINWAPSRDDGDVVQYTIRRDDGIEYQIRADQTDIAADSQFEIDKYWATTTLIDCNYTRFNLRVHRCGDGRQPQPGQTYIYTVTATDDEGQESAASNALSVTFPGSSNAPVPLYNDFFKAGDDNFVQENDLSAVDYWLDDNFSLVFQDEFNDDKLNLNKWQTQLAWGDETIINGEQQYFVNVQEDNDFGYDPFKFTGESLVIEAIPVPDELREKLPAACDVETVPGLDPCEFLSGALSSFDRFSFTYGYTEGRFKVSGAYGALSSFYLYHRYKGTGNSFHAPEIDIVEYLGENPFGSEDAFQTYHYEGPDGGIRSSPTMAYKKPDGGNYADDDWHTFSVLWEPQLVIWYIDGREVKRLSGRQVSRRPMNVVNYLVTGSAWAPTPTNPADFPMQFAVDYIRVYQREPFSSNAYYGP